MKLQEAVGKNFWLSEDELHVELSNLDGWEEDGGYIVKRYQFEDWKKITKFMKAITDLIVKENHHPQLVLDSKEKRRLRLVYEAITRMPSRNMIPNSPKNWIKKSSNGGNNIQSSEAGMRYM